jgi:hypothetical protein
MLATRSHELRSRNIKLNWLYSCIVEKVDPNNYQSVSPTLLFEI